jgi:hypothetical protein
LAVFLPQNIDRAILLLEPDIFCENDEDCVSSEKCQGAPSLDVTSSELSGGLHYFFAFNLI